jgi:hypothetical protein
MTVEIPKGGFRCPFELEGEEAGTILEIPLKAGRSERLDQINSGLRNFADHPESPGAKFSLPFAELEKKCSSLQDLKSAMLPYQAEFAAVQLDIRLPRLLEFEAAAKQRDPASTTSPQEMPVDVVTRFLRGTILKSNPTLPQTTSELADWIERTLHVGIALGVEDPLVLVCDEKAEKRPRVLLSISATSIVMNADREVMADPKTKKDFFVFVRSPFYPREFGRFSEHVEVVFTRKSDIEKLSDMKRRAIRASANKVHQAYGVAVSDHAQQAAGVWIPRDGIYSVRQRKGE